MTICKLLNTLNIGDNTAIVVEGSRELFRNGIGVLDDEGKPFEVMSVGMDEIIHSDDMSNKASLLIKGRFASEKLFV